MTELSVLYEKFLSKITDYRILALTDDEIEESLLEYFDSARAKFYKCKNSLETDDTHILSDLSPYEIEILVSLMLIEHITPQLISSEVMKTSLSDKSFRVYSQANQLREIRLMLERLESKTDKMITKYTFFDLDKEKM